MIEAGIIHSYPFVYRETNIVRKLLAPVMALAMVLVTAGIALAWVQPTLTAECAPDENTYAWKINLHSEDNYKIDWSFASNFAGATTVDFGSAGDHEFLTPAGGPTLYVRWTSDHNSKAQAAANTELCEQPVVEEATPTPTPTPTPTTQQTVEAGTGTPAASVSDTSLNGNGSSPLPTIMFSMVLLASLGTLAYTNVKVANAPRRNR